MRDVIHSIISDFQEREMPIQTRRETVFPVFDGKATVVIGMRRSGKTWFCYQHIADLLASGIEKSRILYLNFEDDRLLDFSIHDFQILLDVYYSRWPENKARQCYFFFDEIQVIDRWESFVRRLLDTENVQVALTGSSSKMLATDIATALRGRTLTCEIFPFSFREFLAATNVFDVVPEHPGSGDTAKLRHAFGRYLQLGGFPEPLHADAAIRREILQSYMETVLFKDVVERHKVANIHALRQLMIAILNNPGQPFSVNKFYNTLKSKGLSCTKNVLYEYLDYLADAYFAHRLPFHSPSVRVRQVNPEKIYGNDTALYRLLMNTNTENLGYLLETLVFLHLRRKRRELSYLQTQGGREIDFVEVNTETGTTHLIQVCADISQPETRTRELRVFDAVAQSFPDAEKLIVTLDDSFNFENGIRVVPAWKFLLDYPSNDCE
ncbi:MAG: ATP-binding protein [Acidobacteriota bacterium]|jgi:predicted AAA+ superfamily ATPase|nr:ATP-binding protein [Acidobacteriota bacterium]